VKYYVCFTTDNGIRDQYWGDYTSERAAQNARRAILRNDETVRSVTVEYRRCSD